MIDKTTPEEKRMAQLEEEIKALRHRIYELENSVRGHLTYHSHVGGPEK